MNAAGLKLLYAKMNDRSGIPSVEKILQSDEAKALSSRLGRPLVLSEIRNELDKIRKDFKPGANIPEIASILNQVEENLEDLTVFSTKPVINATGVILHTNLGRAPISKFALQSIINGTQGYSTLEYDLATGKRSLRSNHSERLLQKLLGVESALVVNNDASAVLLVLAALAHKRRAIISRGQLVEIGGGFRVPDVMRQSGAKLVEIGTTNRVHISDYVAALAEPSGLVLHIHTSNFKIIGFASEPSLSEIVQAAHAVGVPVVDDLGSGALLDTSRFGWSHEPTVQETLAVGTDVVCFSGDKLFGGPQAGIIAGRKEYLDRIKKHPLARAIRADKTLLLGLEATIMHYLKDEAVSEIPVWKMISAPLDEMQVRARKWSNSLQCGDICQNESTIGGGSMPEETIPTWVLSFTVKNPDEFSTRLRKQSPAIITRIQDEKVILDPRTVLPEQDELLICILQKTLAEIKNHEK
jgi:L-seryl-tRNA(Ser) seleniumtransferase